MWAVCHTWHTVCLSFKPHTCGITVSLLCRTGSTWLLTFDLKYHDPIFHFLYLAFGLNSWTLSHTHIHILSNIDLQCLRVSVSVPVSASVCVCVYICACVRVFVRTKTEQGLFSVTSYWACSLCHSQPKNFLWTYLKHDSLYSASINNTLPPAGQMVSLQMCVLMW